MSLITQKQIEQFHTDGYFVTDPVWSSQDLAAASAESARLHREQLDRMRANPETKPRDLEIAEKRFFAGQLHTISPVFARLCKLPIYVEACQKFVGPDADLYYNQVAIKSPSTGEHFAWHQDSGYGHPDPLEYITCWTAIRRATIANGCIWLIPRTHHAMVKHNWNEQERSWVAEVPPELQAQAIPAEMQPGQVAIFSSLLLHKSGPNTSNETRQGYIPQYHRPGVIFPKTNKPAGDQFPVLRAGKPV